MTHFPILLSDFANSVSSRSSITAVLYRQLFRCTDQFLVHYESHLEKWYEFLNPIIKWVWYAIRKIQNRAAGLSASAVLTAVRDNC